MPAELPLIPLRDIVVFPRMLVPLFVGREKSVRAVDQAMAQGNFIMLCAQKKANNEEPDPKDIYPIGCVGEIMQVLRLPDGTVKIMVEGIRRAAIDAFVAQNPFYRVAVRGLGVARVPERGARMEAMMRGLRLLFDRYVKTSNRLPSQALAPINETGDAEELADLIMGHFPLKTDERQQVLAEMDVKRRMEMIMELLEREIEVIQIEKRLEGRVKKQMDQSQREYYLNEQMKAIQKELGRGDHRSELDELRDRIKKSGMPAEAEAKAMKEINKLEQMAPMSAESTVVRNYIEWLADIPWSQRTEDDLSTRNAKKILDEDHYGIEEVKERILDFLAVKQLSESPKGTILCLVGPPGVGKTSLGKSVARAMGRKFVRVSLGGVRDEAEVRGHRRTYIGALPGRIIQSMKKAGTVNPVMMLDEIDKMTADFRGDPSSALLEVLDPEQNKHFSDHYIELDYDLSQVMFIATANVMHSIPAPLLDRMEVIRLSGYMEEEKVKIASGYLVPKQMKENGIKADALELTDEMLTKIVRNYTREAGVRNLERTIAKVCRKVARNVVEHKKYAPRLKAADLEKMLGIAKFRSEEAAAYADPGFANGLAWTEVGGELMHIEVTVVPGKGKLTLTGKLGDVMKESGQAAVTYIRSRAEALGLPADFYSRYDIHIHAPEGAIPKDGPSAGITMASAMVSAFTRIPVRHDTAMTGEITLRGKVLPIGGLKEKALAARRAGIRNVVIPKENVKDLEEIPKPLRKELKFIPVETMDDVLKAVMAASVFKGAKKLRKRGSEKRPPVGGLESPVVEIN
ncbi:MAG: endopeptidase La [Nitrospinae bacterium]|nr:endopeptidase La [Nitrospinota bacterium]